MNPRKKRELDDFVKYLDTFKNKNVSDAEFSQLIFATQANYTENNYASPLFVGESNPYRSKKSQLYYEKLQRYGPLQLYEPLQRYEQSQMYEPLLYLTNHILAKQKREKVEINASIASLADLISIVDTNPYNPECDYNIDLKSLTNIREELAQLNNMIGMKQFKQSILEQLLYFIQELHVGTSTNACGECVKTHEFKHTVIYGPPGTGKTEIAKIIGKMYSKIGVLEKNVFKKVSRNDLVAGYLGQTAMKTKGVINECLGGVLFIDEAYSLAPFMNGELDSYSKECVDILCETLSDHKHDLMVIIAGYEEELNNSFFAANIGLESRFIWRFKIDEYSAEELRMILLKMVGESDWTIAAESIPVKWFEEKKKSFLHYGRDMEMLFTYTKIAHSKRIYGKGGDVRKKLTLEDLNAGYETFMKHKKNKKEKEMSDAMYGLYT